MQDRHPDTVLESGSKPSALVCCSPGRNYTFRTFGTCFIRVCWQYGIIIVERQELDELNRSPPVVFMREN